MTITVLNEQGTMGGRGAFDSYMGRTGGIPIKKREYKEIGRIGRIKIIQHTTKNNNPTPTYSNTANTTYYSYNKKISQIDHIYYYKNHKLVKSVDFGKGETPHVHYWSTAVVGRKRHDSHNTRPLTDRDKRLMNKAKEWNKEHEK